MGDVDSALRKIENGDRRADVDGARLDGARAAGRDATNNISYRLIRLVGRPGERRVVVPAVGRIVEPSMGNEDMPPLRR